MTCNADFVTLEQAAKGYLAATLDDAAILFSTGLEALDEAIGGGIAKGEMVVMAARPSMGKTMMGLQLLQSVAAQGVPAAILSEEMSAEQLGKRSIQTATRIAESDWKDRFDAVFAEVDQHWHNRRSVIIPTRKCGTFKSAVSTIEMLSERHGVEVVVVDYLQLLRGSGKGRYEEVTNGCMMLKSCAVQHNVCLIALCQLNRAIDERRKRRDAVPGDDTPRFSDLRDSGQIEQDADVICFLDWPHQRDGQYDAQDYHIYVAKCRNRGIRQRVVKCKIWPMEQRIEDEGQPVRSDVFDAFNYEP